MRVPPSGQSGASGRRIVVALGTTYLGLAVLYPVSLSSSGVPLEVVGVVSVLTAAPGSIVLYGGYRLPDIDVHTTLYDRIAGWCLGGIGLMSGILALNALINGLTSLVPNVLILTALGSAACFGIGLYDAKARTRAREAEQRSQELAYQNDQLENFARMLAHEIRNPLAIARGYHEQSQPQNQDAAEKVVHAHDRIEAMTDSLLTAVRGSKVDVAGKSTELATVAKQAWEELPASTAGATFRADTEQVIQADPVHIQHLLANLFRNSIEHSDEAVTVRVGDLDDGFYVADDGPGIPAGIREDVMGTENSMRGDRLGIGLTVVAQIADLYGWDWEITDGENGGARVAFTGVETTPR